MLNITEAIAAAERIRTQNGARVHRLLGELDELTEDAMPRGVYDRKKTAAKPAEPTTEPEAPAKKKPGRKPGVKPAKPVEKTEAKPRARVVTQPVPAPIFSVDSTGAVLIRRGDHGMEISREEAIALHDVMHRAEDIIVTEKAEA